MVRLVLLVQGLFGLFPASSSQGTGTGFVTSAIETNLALITASAPALRPIFRSRERGGWFPRTVVVEPTTSLEADPEMGQKPTGWENGNSRPPSSGSGISGKFGRGGSRGGRRGGSGRSGRSGRSTRNGNGRGGSKNISRPIIRVKTDIAELRSQSPRTSEEESMTNNGIMRVSDIQREIDGIVKEIAVTGSGSYTGAGRPPLPTTPPVIPFTPTRPRTADTNMTTRPLTATSSASANGSGRRYAERYYSESVYANDNAGNDHDGSSSYGGDDRMSRRYGVVTPKGTTPTYTTWRESGRPF